MAIFSLVHGNPWKSRAKVKSSEIGWDKGEKAGDGGEQ